jgi:hypothetical protein
MFEGRYSGGTPALHRGVNANDPVAIAAMLQLMGLSNAVHSALVEPFPQRRVVMVGADMLDLPSADGRPPKVEWLPLSAAAGNDIAAAATRDYELKPTKYARPGALVMDDDVAKNLVMTQLQISGRPVFAGAGAVPCRLFSHVSTQNALSSYVASNNSPITFTLQNIHASATQTVRGVWICDTAEIAV